MRVNFNSRTRKYLSMTSLIDIIFLLLLFFMLTSTFNKHDEIEIRTAINGVGSGKQKPNLFISISEQSWKVNGNSIPLGSVGEFLKKLEREEQTKAILRLTTDLSSQALIDAMSLLDREGISATVVK